MAAVFWMAAVLAFTLFTGNSLGDVDQNKLAQFVRGINTEYSIEGQVSWAVNIPGDQDVNKLKNIFKEDPAETVNDKVSKDEVYQGTNVVAAKFKKFPEYTEHAEARVLDNMKPLANRGKGKILLFYSYLSPCGAKCTNTDNGNNILKKIDTVWKNYQWKDHAFVFSKVFDRTSKGTVIKKTEIEAALTQLGKSKLGHKIFRCYKPKNREYKCTNCYIKGKLLNECVDNNV
ncbi:uncharacterized protein si:dkey-96g2.1 [Morone saxatilis]|uniref:uncharacterized protein si:dkey-96g2.1 n=1 Tax=Morone saxatilis TaxID=34816 RepID=UPI0015E241CB|nr:uncharacterized protein si:dkey-96g2.1 [Morone saxatilis]